MSDPFESSEPSFEQVLGAIADRNIGIANRAWDFLRVQIGIRREEIPEQSPQTRLARLRLALNVIEATTALVRCMQSELRRDLEKTVADLTAKESGQ